MTNLLNADPVETLSTAERIEEVALQLFRAKGYEGASIRDIASGSGVALSTIFYYFPNKQAILEQLLHRAVDQLQEELAAESQGVFGSAARLTTCVRVLVVAHCLRSKQSFVAENEFRSLSEESTRDEIRAKRIRIQNLVNDIIADGVDTGEFACESPRLAGLAILTMCTAVASWYRPQGAQSPEHIAKTYMDFALRLVQQRRNQDELDTKGNHVPR